MKKLSSRFIDKCMKTIENNCNNPQNVFIGKELSSFCSNPRNLKALSILEAHGEVRSAKADGSQVPCAVYLESKGVLHFYVKREKMVSGIKGFILGVLSAFIANTLLPYLFNLLL